MQNKIPINNLFHITIYWNSSFTGLQGHRISLFQVYSEPSFSYKRRTFNKNAQHRKP